ncbi:MAG: NUDIX hydrolase [Clostridia bacterium]|nr:NUDIX hydrolase [Clostridia bacterium]
MSYFEDINYAIINKKEAYKGKRVTVEEVIYDNGNKQIYREHVKAGNAVIILAITDDNKVLMVREARSAIGKIILGLPAGKLEKGENPEKAAIRELEEETGFKAHDIKFLREVFTSCGYTDEKISIYLAKDLEKTKQNLDEDEELEVLEIPLKLFKEMIDKNEIITASTTIAGLHYLLYVENNDVIDEKMKK